MPSTQQVQPSLLPGEPDVVIGRRPRAASSRKSAILRLVSRLCDLEEETVILRATVEEALTIKPAPVIGSGKSRCRNWKTCLHPGCMALRQEHELLHKAMTEVREVTSKRQRRIAP